MFGLSAAARPSEKSERRGSVVTVLRELLLAGQSEDVVTLVTLVTLVKQLLARNSELERKLGARWQTNEGVASAQRLMLLDEVKASADEKRVQAGDELRAASGIDEKMANLETKEPPKRPSLRKPAPPNLQRIPNPLPAPAAEGPARSAASSAPASVMTRLKSSSSSPLRWWYASTAAKNCHVRRARVNWCGRPPVTKSWLAARWAQRWSRPCSPRSTAMGGR